MLVESVRRAVIDDRVTTLARVIAQQAALGALENPRFFAEPHPERYARRLIWQDPEEHFIIVGMTWAPGQSTMLHDHKGLWGAEIVVDGVMREIPHRLMACDARGRRRFMPEEERIMNKYCVGVVTPPYEYHVFGNAGTVPAHTLHVYGGSLAECAVFLPENDGWWSAQTVRLGYDA